MSGPAPGDDGQVRGHARITMITTTNYTFIIVTIVYIIILGVISLPEFSCDILTCAHAQRQFAQSNSRAIEYHVKSVDLLFYMA